jgi:hypothetical protein
LAEVFIFSLIVSQALLILLSSHNIYKFSSYLAGNTIHLRSIATNSNHWTTEALSLTETQAHKVSFSSLGSITAPLLGGSVANIIRDICDAVATHYLTAISGEISSSADTTRPLALTVTITAVH